jgi:methionyl-tRNA formyltransferase
MRIAFFHNWSWIGSALGRSLLEAQSDDLWMIGGPVPRAERDQELIQLAKRCGVLQVAPKNIGAPQFAKRLLAFQPDLIVVGTFAKKLPPSLLAIPRVAAINVHSSLLPSYRGALPEFWVIRNGERSTGITIHHMTEEFDAGRIISRAPIPLLPDDNLLTVSMRLAHAAVPALNGLLDRYRRGERPDGELQDPSRVSPAPLVREHHLRIDWRESAQSIERLSRAAFPVFDMHAFRNGEKLVIRSVREASDVSEPLAPGELHLDRARERLIVGTGQGALALMRIEAHGDAATGFRWAERYALALSPGERLD